MTVLLDHTTAPDGVDRILREVRFACARCGNERPGSVVGTPGIDLTVICRTCGRQSDEGVLDVPTESLLASWRAQALQHARSALRSAARGETCSLLALVWCRRLAPELTPWGKVAFLDATVRHLDRPLTCDHRRVLVEIGVALQMTAPAVNGFIEDVTAFDA